MVKFTNGSVSFVPQGVALPSKESIVAVAVSNMLNTHNKIEVCMDVALQKKATKGYNIYGRQELRNRINMMSSTVKQVTGLIDEYCTNDNLEDAFNNGKDTLEKMETLVQPKGTYQIPVDRLRKALENHTGEYLDINI